MTVSLKTEANANKMSLSFPISRPWAQHFRRLSEFIIIKNTPRIYSVSYFRLPPVVKASPKPDDTCWKKYIQKSCLPVNLWWKTTKLYIITGNQNIKNRKRKEKHAPKNRNDLLSKCYSFLLLPAIPACKCRCRTTVHREVSFSTRRHKRYPQPIIWIVAISTICSCLLYTSDAADE